MHSWIRPTTLVLAAVAVAASTWVVAQRGAPSAAPAGAAALAVGRIVADAQALLLTLDDAGRAKVQFPFEGPQKARWSNLPTGIFQREGLRMGDLTPPQRAAVSRLLETALSAEGFRKVTDIIRGDEVLRATSGGGRGGAAAAGRGPAGAPAAASQPAAGNQPPQAPPNGGRRGGGRGPGGGGLIFGEDEYYLAFVGAPSTTAPWMLQFGGHHLAINLTMAGSQATLAPSLPAAQPARFTIEGREIEPLGDENNKAFALMNALDVAQRGQATIGARVADLVLGAGQDGRTIAPEGLLASSMTPAQQTMLLDLVREWAGIATDALASPRMDDIRAALPQTYFAWSGPTEAGSAAYFRIQGPTLVIEYAPQGGLDHIHTIYRDPTNDYGAKFASR